MAKKVKKDPIVHKLDGYKFKTKPMLDFYIKLKELKAIGRIKSFTLPDFEEQNVKSKYGSKKCEIDGEMFDSIMEGKFYVYIKEQKRIGKIKSFEIHPVFPLLESFPKYGKVIRSITYISDFRVMYADGSEIIYDVKGRETADFKIKKKLFDFKYRNLILKCVQYRVKEDDWIDIHEREKENKKKKKTKKTK